MTHVVGSVPDFLHCCALDGRGGAGTPEIESISQWSDDLGVLWLHLDVSDEASQAWLHNESGLEPVIVDVLLADETRPRSFSTDRGLLVVLRGVNTNPGADPEDMVSIRVWIEKNQNHLAVFSAALSPGWLIASATLSTTSRNVSGKRKQ
jgi:Mg2+ and Co2+ transporter CorA